MVYISLEGIHPSWKPFFTPDVIRILENIDDMLIERQEPFNPNPENILRFAQQPLNEVKVLILGQDTYPAAGVATGRAFEVGGLSSWDAPFRQVSLKNIVKNLYGTYTRQDPYCSYSKVLAAIKDGSFPILPPDKLMGSWADQGVLLLNAALTCEVGLPGSHSAYWQPFTAKLLDWVAQQNPALKVFLWGKIAQQYKPIFDNGFREMTIYTCDHPMMCSSKKASDFLKFKGFADTMDEINWLGRS